MVLPDSFDSAARLLERVVKGEAEIATASQKIQQEDTSSSFTASKSDLLIVKKREEEACECLRIADMSTGRTLGKYLSDPFQAENSKAPTHNEAPSWFQAFRLSAAETIAAQVMYMTPQDARSLEALAPVASQDVFVHTRVLALAETLAAAFKCDPEDVSFVAGGRAVDRVARLDSLFRAGTVEVRVNKAFIRAGGTNDGNDDNEKGGLSMTFSINGGLPLMDYSLRQHPRAWEAITTIAGATGIMGFLLGLMTNIR